MAKKGVGELPAAIETYTCDPCPGARLGSESSVFAAEVTGFIDTNGQKGMFYCERMDFGNAMCSATHTPCQRIVDAAEHIRSLTDIVVTADAAVFENVKKPREPDPHRTGYFEVHRERGVVTIQ